MLKRWFDKNKFHKGNVVTLLQSGVEFFSELERMILSANHFIHIQIYIFDDDEIGMHIINLLKKKAAQGVKIFIVVDGYGSEKISKRNIEEMKKVGIKFKVFSPVQKILKFQIGRRLHHKIILVDGKSALIGGINISNRYNGSLDEIAWLDFAVKVEGVVCNDILIVCEDVWRKKMKYFFKNELHPFIHLERKSENISVRLLQNDFVRRNIEISRFYRQSIKNSFESLTIVSSYFLPGNRMRHLLKKASQRGVKIKLLLSSKSDVGLMKHATDYLYPFLLRNGIEIYEWQASVMHGKLMIIDNKFTTVGSYNINTLSDYGSLELNVCVDDVAFSETSTTRINQLISSGCKKIIAEDYIKQHYWWNKLINWLSYQLMRTSLKLLFLLMRK